MLNIEEWKFPINSIVTHLKSGNTYVIVGHGNLEKDCIPAYFYGNSYKEMWARSKEEFEDGRFVLGVEKNEQ